MCGVCEAGTETTIEFVSSKYVTRRLVVPDDQLEN